MKNILITSLIFGLAGFVGINQANAQFGYGGNQTGSGRGFVNTPAPQRIPDRVLLTPAPFGQVLGAENFRFGVSLRRGGQSNDVKELQKRLRAEGFFTYPTDTGFFGPITFASVQAYQSAHGIPSTGFVGPLTRAELNK